jgi:predicted CXXCH cytochrome family protein
MKTATKRFSLLLAACFLATVLTAVVSAESLQLDENEICMECHDDLRASQGLPNAHAPFVRGDCSECHSPHASSHAALLRHVEKALCEICHPDIASSGAEVHSPVKMGYCMTCHDPHASEQPDLLHRPIVPLCSECHQQVTQWSTAKVRHEPVEDGECKSCHDVHASDQAHLLVSAVPGLCFDCHSNDVAFRSAHNNVDLSDANCSTCHDPHASNGDGLLHVNQHEPYAAGDCATCHGQGESYKVDDVQRLCLRCHRELIDDLAMPFRSHMVNEGSCVNCHNAHVASQENLLAAPMETLCLRCHFTDEETGGKIEGWVTHEGTACMECHVPHGANNAQYLKTTMPELCLGCHANSHNGSHPVGAEIIDPRTNEQVTCLSCHQMHAAPFPQYLPLDPGFELCILCHKK